jgi:antitoxin Phd
MDSFPITKLNRAASEVLDVAHRRPVELTERGKRKYVLMAADHYDTMFKRTDTRRAFATNNLPPDIKDLILNGINQELGETEE